MRGNSVIELLVVVAIFAIVATLAATPFILFKKTSALGAAVSESIALLEDARARTLSSRNASQYGVHFDESRAVLFSGAVFDADAPWNEESVFNSAVEAAQVALAGGGEDVVFKRLTGETDDYGTVTFWLTSDTTKTKILRIGRTGVVSAE